MVRFYLPNLASIFRFELCLPYIHIHLKPGILAEKNLELWLKPTTAKYVQDRSTNSTICWFTKEIIKKMKTNPFSIVMFVAKLSKKWITWKITGKYSIKSMHKILKYIVIWDGSSFMQSSFYYFSKYFSIQDIFESWTCVPKGLCGCKLEKILCTLWYTKVIKDNCIKLDPSDYA